VSRRCRRLGSALRRAPDSVERLGRRGGRPWVVYRGRAAERVGGSCSWPGAPHVF
jgi:hypothetical protein